MKWRDFTPFVCQFGWFRSFCVTPTHQRSEIIVNTRAHEDHTYLAALGVITGGLYSHFSFCNESLIGSPNFNVAKMWKGPRGPQPGWSFIVIRSVQWKTILCLGSGTSKWSTCTETVVQHTKRHLHCSIIATNQFHHACSVWSLYQIIQVN